MGQTASAAPVEDEGQEGGGTTYSGLIDHAGTEDRPIFVKASNDPTTPLKVYSGQGSLLHSFGVKDSSKTPLRNLSQVMSLSQGGTFLVRGEALPSSFLGVNVETGQTTDTVAVKWKGKGLDLRTMTPQKRHAQYVDSGPVVELFGVAGEKGDVLWAGMYDPRTGEKPNELHVGAKAANRFATLNFTCCATTRLGYMVTGDVKGDVRLNKDVDRASAVIAGYGGGQPVLGVDVTADGKNIMWTYADAIYMVQYPEGEESWGARGVPHPVPVRLVVRENALEKILKDEEEALFLPAKFDLGTVPEGSESAIVGVTEKVYSYLGDWQISWNMRTIDQAHARLRRAVNDHREGAPPIPVPEIPSSREICANGEVEDHVVLRNNDVASLTEGIKSMW